MARSTGRRHPTRPCAWWDHGAVAALQSPARWTTAAEEADWVARRLAPFDGHSVASVVPTGFAAYARILHPAEEPGRGSLLVRWRDVARWSGVDLRPDTQFHTIALPPERPGGPPPWRGQGPAEGRLYGPDAEALAAVLRCFTSTPEDCCFGLWDGYDFAGVPLTSLGSSPAAPRPDPIPAEIRRGPRVHLPGRDHLLYAGPVEAIAAPAGLGHGQTANLAWPKDRAWCVASEVDLAWTYVAGSEALVRAVLADGHIEALPADPADPLTRIEACVADLVERGVDELLDGGHTLISTSMGSVEAWLEPPTRWRSGAIRTKTDRYDGSAGGSSAPLHRSEDPRTAAGFHLTGAVVGLVGE